jgi:hypothetical protein
VVFVDVEPYRIDINSSLSVDVRLVEREYVGVFKLKLQNVFRSCSVDLVAQHLALKCL